MRLSPQTIAALSLSLSLNASSFAGLAPAPVTPVIEPPASQDTAVSQDALKAEMPTAFREGEQLKFSIKWGLVTGGYSSLKVENIETIAGRPAYHVVAEARSTGMVDTFYRVKDRNEAWVDPKSPSTLRYARNIEEGKFRLEEQVEMNPDTNQFSQRSYRADKKRHKTNEGPIPPNTLDILGSLYYLRTLPLEVGKSYTMDVHSSNKVYPLVIKVKKRQTVRVKAGKFDCFVVEPKLREPGIFVTKGKKLEVYLTADERRMPVLMRSEIFIGHVSAELVSHRTVPPAETYALSQIKKEKTSSEEVAQ